MLLISRLFLKAGDGSPFQFCGPGDCIDVSGIALSIREGLAINYSEEHCAVHGILSKQHSKRGLLPTAFCFLQSQSI